jgi:PAS domain S-box-containing protein
MQSTLPTLPHLMIPKLSSRGRILFGLGLGILIGLAFITWQSTRHFLATAERVTHSREILETEEKVLRHLMEMESARRGFIITGDEWTLRPFYEARTLVNENFRRLGELLAADHAPNGSATPTQQSQIAFDRLGKLRSLLDQSFAKQAEEIATRRKDGFEAAQALFATTDSEVATQEIHAVIADFEERERMRLLERSDTTRIVGAATTLIIILGSSAAIVALLASGWAILRDFALRRRAEAALAQQARLLSDIIDTMPELIYLKDREGRYVLDNRAHRRYLGVTPGENIYGKTAWDVYPKEIAQRHTDEDQYVMSTGAPVREREEEARPAAPNIRWLSTTRIPLRDPGGRIVGLVGVSLDITQRRADEEKLRRFAAQLESSNAELQNFASVASHDLQEPLRKIQAFGDRLRAKCAEQLSSQGQDYLDRMQNAAERMQTLIQDLLQLSRVTSRAQPFQQCDLPKIVNEVIGDLEVRLEQTRGKIEVEQLPTIEADPLQMRQLFQNLISNALKFHRPEEPPLVRIQSELFAAVDQSIPGARPPDKIARIIVQDNGIGFDPKYADQIFSVFQRLHTKTEYEGTGIGLAVCRKITDRHGGTIVAESEEGRGSTFTITLPVKQINAPETS